jgi:hypothetical protein
MDVHVSKSIARIVGLTSPRIVKHNFAELSVGEAKVVVNTPKGPQYGHMLFWNENAHIVERLVLGKTYRFLALTKEYEDCMLLFYTPMCTEFYELTQEEVRGIDP